MIAGIETKVCAGGGENSQYLALKGRFEDMNDLILNKSKELITPYCVSRKHVVLKNSLCLHLLGLLNPNLHRMA